MCYKHIEINMCRHCFEEQFRVEIAARNRYCDQSSDLRHWQDSRPYEKQYVLCDRCEARLRTRIRAMQPVSLSGHTIDDDDSEGEHDALPATAPRQQRSTVVSQRYHRRHLNGFRNGLFNGVPHTGIDRGVTVTGLDESRKY